MKKEVLRLQMLSGIISESVYKEKLEENNDPNEALRQAEDLLNYPEGSLTDIETAIDKVEEEYFLHMWRRNPRKEPLLNWLNKYNPIEEYNSKESLNENKQKIKISKKELAKIISEEIVRFKKKSLLENRLREIDEELKNL